MSPNTSRYVSRTELTLSIVLLQKVACGLINVDPNGFVIALANVKISQGPESAVLHVLV